METQTKQFSIAPWLRRKDIICLFVILIIAAFFRFYQLESRFYFEFDQERDALEVWNIVKNQPIRLIGPQVIGQNAFFLGPLWYYLLVPFYVLFQMSPIGAAVFGGLIGILTTIAFFIVTKRLTSTIPALVASFFWAINSDRSVWNPMLIPLVTLAILYSLYKMIEGSKWFIAVALLLIGIAFQFHFQALFFFVPFAVSYYLCIRQTKSIALPQLFAGIVLFGLTWLPLIVFDLRHDFVISQGFQRFLTGSGAVEPTSSAIGLSLNGLIKFFDNIAIYFPVMFISKTLLGVLLVIVAVAGIIFGSITRNIKLLLLAMLLTPPLLFLLYGGVISEYYFALTLVPIFIGFGLLAQIAVLNRSYGKLIVIGILIAILFAQTRYFLPKTYPYSFKHKKEAVLYIINQPLDPIFNVSYSTPPNFNHGFRYLFTYLGKEPQNIPEGHLWTIVIPINGEDIPPVATFGDIGVIRR